MTGLYFDLLPGAVPSLSLLARRAIEAKRLLDLYDGNDAEWNRLNSAAFEAVQIFRQSFAALTEMSAETVRQLVEEGILP